MMAVEVERGLWMLLRVRDGVLLRDLGWFVSREAAEAHAHELLQLFGGVRRTVHMGLDAAALN